MAPQNAWMPYEPPLPKFGDILDCCIPFAGLRSPEIEPHPAIICRRFLFAGQTLYAVIGGTAVYHDDGRMKRLKSTEVILDEGQRAQAGLRKPTKFGFNKECIRLFPYTDQFFPSDPHNKNIPHRYGFVSIEDGPFWDAVKQKGLDTAVTPIIREIIDEITKK